MEYYTSPIAGHDINNLLIYSLYVSHAIVVPAAVLVPFLQLYWERPNHRNIGTIFLKTLFPWMVATGVAMSFCTSHRVPSKLVFVSYGYSYFLFGWELLGKNVVPLYHTIGQWLSGVCVVALFYLSCVSVSNAWQLLIVMAPLSWMHSLVPSHQKKSINRHRICGLVFIYLGLLGTAFTFSFMLPCQILVQNLPFLWFLFQYYKK